MPNLSQRARNLTIQLGVLLTVGGFVLFWLLQPRMAQLPHYQQVALCLPLLIGTMMMQINTYLDLGDEVTSSNARPQGFAVALLVAIPLVLCYCIISWLHDVAG